MDYENNAKLAALQTIREIVGDETFNAIMDKAIEVSEAGIADEVNAIRFAAADAVDEATCDIIDAIIDESTKAATVGTSMAKGAVNGAIKSGAWGAAFGATSLNPEVRKAKKELKDAENDGNDKKIAKAEEKLRSARIAGAKKSAISSAKSGAIVGAVGGGLAGAEKYKETHTGEHGEPIIDVKNHMNSKKRLLKESNSAIAESVTGRAKAHAEEIDAKTASNELKNAKAFYERIKKTGSNADIKNAGQKAAFAQSVVNQIKDMCDRSTKPIDDSVNVMTSIWGSEEQFGG